MTSPKITIYFTPDVKEINRIPISDIKFPASEELKRGRFQIDISSPCIINADCTSHRASIKSTATLNFIGKCFGERSEYVFKNNDYFEIWNTADTRNPWCYFRGVVTQTARTWTANKRSFSLTLDNSGGWLLGDNAIYYLGQLIITQQHVTNNFFNAIKVRYGWATTAGKETDKGKALGLLKVKSPSQLLETLINRIANERVKLLKSDFYENQDSIKPIDYETGNEVDEGGKRNVFVVDKLSEMEGSILEILKQFEGRPFAEIFIVETKEKSKLIWRNSRWHDSDDILCMGDRSGKAENIVSIYTDPSVNFTNTTIKSEFSAQNNYISEKQFSGFLKEDEKTTSDDVVNAFYIYPVGFDTKQNIPSVIITQTAYDKEGARQILDESSVIRHGYRPITIKLPFIPDFGEASDFSEKDVETRSTDIKANRSAQARIMLEYTGYASKMYRNIQNSGNGQTVMQNNLECTVADDFRVFRTEQESPFFVNVHQMTWYFDAKTPRTVLQWDRGFERPLGSDKVSNIR
jgi:hypothetical protein